VTIALGGGVVECLRDSTLKTQMGTNEHKRFGRIFAGIGSGHGLSIREGGPRTGKPDAGTCGLAGGEAEINRPSLPRSAGRGRDARDTGETPGIRRHAQWGGWGFSGGERFYAPHRAWHSAAGVWYPVGL
jgi:hypothetical protein